LGDANGFQITACSILEPIGSIAGQDRLLVSLTTIDDDAFRTAMPFESLAQEPFGSREIAPLAEPELHCVTVAVDCAVEIPPLSTDLDIGFINMPFAGNGSFAPIEPLQQFGRVPDDPPVNDL
jgi:hypothetical protein